MDCSTRSLDSNCCHRKIYSFRILVRARRSHQKLYFLSNGVDLGILTARIICSYCYRACDHERIRFLDTG
jgi:hypothetical protein